MTPRHRVAVVRGAFSPSPASHQRPEPVSPPATLPGGRRDLGERRRRRRRGGAPDAEPAHGPGRQVLKPNDLLNVAGARKQRGTCRLGGDHQFSCS
jgi:hypothetical protein